MLVVMKKDASPEQIEAVCLVIEGMGYEARPIPGAQRTAIGLVGNQGRVDSTPFEGLPGIAEIIHVSKPFKQVSLEWKPERTVIPLANGVTVGEESVVIMAGPCSVESSDQILETAKAVKAAGATVLRGGAFKPRTSPYSFQGLGEEGLRLLAEAGEATGLAVVTEALDIEVLPLVEEYSDIIQIGARNMQNFSLLRRAGQARKPILLKRGMAATIDDLLLAAEYIYNEGNEQIILCERGVRHFDSHTRNLMDLAAIPVVKGLSHLPIIADPSHGTGRRDKVIPMARAAVAAGADGVMVEVHPHPEQALSDGPQSLYPEQFAQLVEEIRIIATALGRDVASLPIKVSP